jgi:DNA-directed RNA polymerase subunit RPC12/RpoP
MNKIKKSQNIAIMLMILILIVGMCLMIFAYVYDDVSDNSGQTAEQGRAFSVNPVIGTDADVEINVETTAKEPPKFFIISAHNFKEISPDRSVPNEYTNPELVAQIDQASAPGTKQIDKKDYEYNKDLGENDWYVLVVTNQTEGGIAFNMIYDISVYSFRPLWPVFFAITIILEALAFVYILVINTKLKKVQEKVSTQRLLKAQMNMVRNFILQSSGTSSQAFGFAASPYRSDSGEGVPRDGIPLAIANKEMEIVECYGCNELITINSPERPLIVACPNCGVKLLQKKRRLLYHLHPVR